MLNRPVRLKTRLDMAEARTRLQHVFDRDHVPPLQPAFGERVLIGVFEGTEIRLRIVDTRWRSAPFLMFRGVLEAVDAETHLVGFIGYDAFATAVLSLAGLAFSV